MTQTYVLACSKLWIPDLAQRLEKKLNQRFLLVQKEDELNLSFLKSQQVSKVFLPHWSYLVPKEIYSQVECIVFHMTDLPFGRGGSPLQNLIIRGHKSTRVSALRCEEELDAGPIYCKSEPFDISKGSAAEIFYQASLKIEQLIETIVLQNPIPIKQEGIVTIFQRRKPQESKLPDFKTLQATYDFIRMLDAPGYPRAYSEQEEFRIEYSRAELNKGELSARAHWIKKSNSE